MESEKSNGVVLPLHDEPERPSIPAFTKENIERTAKQMYPGCSVIWSKTNGKRHRMTVLIYGEHEPEDLLPFSMEGELMQIAKTLVTMFACCQHFVLQQIKHNMKMEQMQQQEQIVTVGGVQPVNPQQSSIILPGG